MIDPYVIAASLVGLTVASTVITVDKDSRAGLQARLIHDDRLGADVAQPPPPSKIELAVAHEPSTALRTGAVVARARREVELGVKYDASYRVLSQYPNGDVPEDVGACTDLIIRAFRAAGVDLQQRVHEDLRDHLDLYGVEAPNTNVDHRRTGTLFTFFERKAVRLPVIERDKPWLRPASSLDARARARESFQPGDIVFFNYKTKCHAGYRCIPDHVAIISDRVGTRGLPLVIQNGGPHPVESDSLDGGTMVGHFRMH